MPKVPPADGPGRPRGLPARFLSLEAGRFFAALAVVLFHVGITMAEPKYLGHYATTWFAGGFAGVDFFFVLSGFVIVTAHQSDFGKGDRGAVTRTFIRKRFVRLYPALWGVLAVLVPAILLVPALRWAGPVSLVDAVGAFAAVPLPAERILAVEWTLRYELLFYASFALLLWHRGAGALAFAALAILSIASLAIGFTGFFVTPYPLLFMAGAAIAWLARGSALRFGRLALAAGAALFGWRLAVCALAPDRHAFMLMDTVAFGTGATFIVYGLVALEAGRPVPVPAWLLYLGRASYALYLVHYPVVSAGTKLAMRLRPLLPELVLAAMVAALALASGIVFHQLVERRLVAFAQRLLGGTRSGERRPA